MMDVLVCIQQTQYRVESALNGIYALVFVPEISVNNSCVNAVRPHFP